MTDAVRTMKKLSSSGTLAAPHTLIMSALSTAAAEHSATVARVKEQNGWDRDYYPIIRSYWIDGQYVIDLITDPLRPYGPDA